MPCMAMINSEKYKFYRNLSLILGVILTASILLCAFLVVRSANISVPADTTGTADTVKTEGATVLQTENPTESDGTNTPDASYSEYEHRIDELEKLLNNYEQASADAFESQSDCLTRFLELLSVENRPLRSHVDNNGKPTGELTPADVSFCYTDLTTGAVFSYNADEVRYSASLIKAPYVYAMFKAVEEFEYNKLNFASDGTPLYDADGKPLFEGPHPNLDADGKIKYLEGEEKYDLSRTWIYDSAAMFVEGSGNIQDKEDGFTLTYLELACYALKYSDNIAFSEIMKSFGYAEHDAMLASLEIAGADEGFMELSAEDCVKYLREIYKYCEKGSVYAKAMKEAMLTAPYTVMLPDAMSPIPCAHKYGWDVAAYHDMAIVYDERPFALVIMTDLDSGHDEDYEYIQAIAKAILDLHRSNTSVNT